MYHGESPAQQIILSCAKPLTGRRTDVKAIEGSSIDWSHVLSMARRHRIMPLLHIYLSKQTAIGVPEEIASLIKQHTDKQALANLFQTNELVKILGQLGAAGIEAMPFKGPALGQYLYDNLAIRPFGDLDILIHRNQYAETKTVLMQNAYRPFRSLSPVQEQAFLDTQMGFEFIRADEQSVIEVHWSFLNAVHAFKMSTSEVWDRKQTLDLAGGQVYVFSPTHLMVYLCAHGSKSLWGRLRWICDIAELADKHQDRAFWDEVIQIAQQSRSKRMLLTGLSLAHNLLEAPLPDAIHRTIESDSSVAVLTERVATTLFTPPQAETLGAHRVSFHLQMHERFLDRLPYYKHLLQLWSAPSTKDKDFVALPRYLEFLYILIKPIRLLLHKGR